VPGAVALIAKDVYEEVYKVKPESDPLASKRFKEIKESVNAAAVSFLSKESKNPEQEDTNTPTTESVETTPNSNTINSAPPNKKDLGTSNIENNAPTTQPTPLDSTQIPAPTTQPNLTPSNSIQIYTPTTQTLPSTQSSSDSGLKQLAASISASNANDRDIATSILKMSEALVQANIMKEPPVEITNVINNKNEGNIDLAGIYRGYRDPIRDVRQEFSLG